MERHHAANTILEQHATGSLVIPATDVASQGTVQVTAVNSAPNAGLSTPATFTINALTSNPLPSLGSLSDTTAPAGWPGFPLAVNGTGFVEATSVQWNGLNRPTDVLNSTLVKGAIPGSDLATAGTAQVGLSNPSPGGGSSNAVNFSIKSVAPGTVGVIERSSLASDLTEADADSGSPAMSADGRFVVFTSNADSLVPGDTNGVADAFLRDTCLGASTGCTPSVVRVSVASDGTQADQGSSDVAISGNGRYVAFSSRATNLVPGVTSGNLNVFLRDTCLGASGSCTASTTLVSQDANDSFAPTLSADGRRVAFTIGTFTFDCGSYCTAPPDFLAFVRDTCTGASAGCMPSTTVVSVANDGSAPNDTTIFPLGVVSADGRYIAFQSLATNLVSNDTNQAGDVFLRDTCFGVASGCTPSTARVSVANDGSQTMVGGLGPSVSASGRFVAFTGANGGNRDVFVRDTCSGAAAGCTPSTTTVSVANGGSQSNGDSQQSSMSANGRFVAFTSDATNLVAGDTSPFPKIFLHDTCAGVTSGCTPSTILLSVALDGAANNQSSSPWLSGSAHYVVFVSLASNLGPGDTNQTFDVFVARTGLP